MEAPGGAESDEEFLHQMCGYDDTSLRMIHEYFEEDLLCVLESVDITLLLCGLHSKDILDEDFRDRRRGEWNRHLYKKLFWTILEKGRSAVIGLWECLHDFAKHRPHPNLLAVLGEIQARGDNLVAEIHVDRDGHSLSPELKEIQTEHKYHLMEKTMHLVEHRPPSTTLEPQKFFINERYVNLVVVSTHQFRQRSRNELEQMGIQHEECLNETQTRLEHISPDRLFRWSHQSECIPHSVMVSGVPGIGKTTLVQKFVYDWVNGNLYQRFAFVFFFRFRELNRLGEASVEGMILNKYPYLQNHIEEIFQRPERLLFIFDGLDEINHTIDFKFGKKLDPKHRRVSGEIVASLVRQKLLKGCSVLLTSRPTKLASIDTDVFQRMAEIMGFLHEDRRTFFRNFFGDAELSEKAFRYVQEKDTLYTFCYIPSYCWIICTVLAMCFQAHPPDALMTSLPKTVTQLFVAFVSNLLANHSQNNDDARSLLTSVGRMAEHGVLNLMIVFDGRDLQSHDVHNSSHLFSCFLVESGRPPDIEFSFLHLTLQEFFAAFFHFIDYNAEKLKATIHEAESLEDCRAEVFFRFLCGLSDNSTRSMLKSFVGELSKGASNDVITWLKAKTTQQKAQRSPKEKRQLLHIFHCLHESRNKALISQSVGLNHELDFSSVPLTPLDCYVLAFILQSCTAIHDVNLDLCTIKNEGLRKLLPALHTVHKLSLSDNELTDTSCPLLASAIRDNQTLKRLVLTGNKLLEGPQSQELMAALTTSRIEELELKYNELTEASGPLLASGIRDNVQLRRLVLSRNNMEGPGLGQLMEALTSSHIEDLELEDNGLTEASGPLLASGIRNNGHLRRLVLSRNKMEGPGLKSLMEALTSSRIENLQLNNNHLTSMSCPHLASGIRDNQNLRTLILSSNMLEGHHLQDLMEALTTSKIEELRLIDNRLKATSCSHLASGIQDNQTLRTLILSRNMLGEEPHEEPHLQGLMEALKTSKMEELHLDMNRLTGTSCPLMALGIRDHPTLKTLVLSGNNLEGPHLGDLMEAVTTSRIEVLSLSNNNLSEESCAQLSLGLRGNRTLREINLSNNPLQGPHLSQLEAALAELGLEKSQRNSLKYQKRR